MDSSDLNDQVPSQVQPNVESNAEPGNATGATTLPDPEASDNHFQLNVESNTRPGDHVGTTLVLGPEVFDNQAQSNVESNAEPGDGTGATSLPNSEALNHLVSPRGDPNAGPSDATDATSLPTSEPFDHVRKLHNFLRNIDHESDQKGDKEEELKIILQPITADQINIQSPGDEGKTALHIAINSGLVKACQFLLDRGASVDEADSKGKSALHHACLHGEIELVKLIMSHNADVLAVDQLGRTPLHYAAKTHTNITNEILTHKDIDLESTDTKFKWTPLHFAVYHAKFVTTKALLAKGASVSAKDADGWTPLMMAAWRGLIKTTDILLEHDQGMTQLDVTDKKGDTPLLTAIRRGNPGTALKLLAAGADCNARQKSGVSCLHWAIWKYSKNFFDAMIAKETLDVTIQDDEGKTALHYICGASHEGSNGRFVLTDGKVNNNENQGGNKSENEQRYCEILDLFLKQGAFPGAETQNGKLPLHFALDERGNQFVKKLLAASENHVRDAIQTGLEHGSADGTSMLENVLRRADETVAQEENIMDDLARICQHPTIYDTALFWAARHHHDFAKSLLSSENVKDEGSLETPRTENWCAIEWAAYKHQPQILWWLIATSPRDNQSQNAVREALKLLEDTKAKEEAMSLPSQDTEVGNDQERMADDQTVAMSLSSSPENELIRDILRSPPYGQLQGKILRDSVSLTRPRPRGEDVEILEKFTSQVIRFYRGTASSSTMRRDRDVNTVIYTTGPKTLMEEANSDLRQMLTKNPNGVKDSSVSDDIRAMYDDANSRFTWIHLPVTHLDWMKDLLRTIMHGENHKPHHYDQASSFLRDTWFEIPDRTSESRFMRPQFLKRTSHTSINSKQEEGTVKTAGQTAIDKTMNNRLNDGKEQMAAGQKMEKDMVNNEQIDDEAQVAIEQQEREKEEEKMKKEKEPREEILAASALYMPFLSLSTHCTGSRKEESRFKEPMVRLKSLKDTYDNPVIHESSTLDESYYHFATDYHTQIDRHERNFNQVVTKLLGNEFEGIRWLSEISIMNDSSSVLQSDLSTTTGLPSTGSSLANSSRNGSARVGSTQIESAQTENTQTGSSQSGSSRTSSVWSNSTQASSSTKTGISLSKSIVPILRVNQLWVWTLDEKWVISATSPPVDDEEPPWVDGFIEHLGRRADVGGVQSQPESAEEMVKVMVDYCIGSYERPPPKESTTEVANDASNGSIVEVQARPPDQASNRSSDQQPRQQSSARGENSSESLSESLGDYEESISWKNKHSIRQVFSNYLNFIGRSETRLFKQFEDQMKNEEEDWGKHAEHIKVSIAGATRLYSEIKDVRDELNILKSIANYQRIVQNQLFDKRWVTLDLAASYMVSDLEELDKLAGRIETAVNTMISLQENEVANSQAKLANEQAKVSMQQAVETKKQGSVVLVFTVATILFLPMSFLTSVFAMDIESFRKTPKWAFGIIFGVSFAFFTICAVYAIFSTMPKPPKPAPENSSRSGSTDDSIQDSSSVDSELIIVGKSENSSTQGVLRHRRSSEGGSMV